MKTTSYGIYSSVNNTSENTTTEKNKNNESTFEKALKEENTKETPEQTTRNLVDDIMSLFKTGLTVAELESLEKLIKEIQKLIREEATSLKNNTKDTIDSLINKLEMALMQIQKQTKGEAIKEADNNFISGFFDSVKEDISSFELKLDDLKNMFNEIKQIDVKNPVASYNHNELELLQELKRK